MDEAAQRLRQYVARARAVQGLRDNTDLAEAANVKYRTLVNVLAGKPTRAAAAVELALGWAPGSIDAVLGGGEPTVTSEKSRPEAEVDRRPVGLGLDDAAEGLTAEDIQPVLDIIRATKRLRGLAE